MTISSTVSSVVSESFSSGVFSVAPLVVWLLLGLFCVGAGVVGLGVVADGLLELLELDGVEGVVVGAVGVVGAAGVGVTIFTEIVRGLGLASLPLGSEKPTTGVAVMVTVPLVPAVMEAVPARRFSSTQTNESPKTLPPETARLTRPVPSLLTVTVKVAPGATWVEEADTFSDVAKVGLEKQNSPQNMLKRIRKLVLRKCFMSSL